MMKKIREYFKEKEGREIQAFCHKYRSKLIIIADPNDDTIIATHKDKSVMGRLRSPDGKFEKVIKNVIKSSLFEHEIDKLIGGLTKILEASLSNRAVQHFVLFLDGALFNISKALNKKSV